MVYDDNSDEEDDNISYRSEEDELLNRSSGPEEEAMGNDSDYLEELPEEDDASYGTESSFRSHSTLGSTPGTRTKGYGDQGVRGPGGPTPAVLCVHQAKQQPALFKMEPLSAFVYRQQVHGAPRSAQGGCVPGSRTMWTDIGHI